MMNHMHPAPIDDKGLERVRALEQKLGKVLVAVEPDPAYARLDREELAALQQAERELDTILIAYEKA